MDNLLSEHGYKNTPARLAILDIFSKSKIPLDAEIVCKKLKKDVSVDQFYDRETAERAIEQTNYSLIVLDIELPPEKMQV